MAQTSRFWDGTVTGDATTAPYDAATEFAKALGSAAGAFGVPTNFGGVCRGELNQLAVTGATSPIAIASGRAIVYGTWYENDAAVSQAIATPAVSSRIDVIVLRKSWVAQTVRIAVVTGVEGGGAPALTQTAGVTWDIPLTGLFITTGGAITLLDARQFIPYHGNQSAEGGIVHNYTQMTGSAPTMYEVSTELRHNFWDEFDALGSLASSQPTLADDHYTRVGTATSVTILPDANGDTYCSIGGSSTAVGIDQGLTTRVRQMHTLKNPEFKSIIGQQTAPIGGTVEWVAGLMDNVATTGQQNGIYFRSVNSGNWFLVCRAAGVETTVNMGIAPSGTKISLELRVGATGTSVQGYVNGALTGLAITTNIPSLLMTPIARCDNRAATVTTAGIIRLFGWGWRGDR